jgi:uncharacterized protein
MKNNVSGCTVWSVVDGFGKRKRSIISLECVTINMPLIIEFIDIKAKIKPILPQISRIVGDNGVATLHEVDAI